MITCIRQGKYHEKNYRESLIFQFQHSGVHGAE